MPAVSGSTTQIATSALTAADLGGTPDDAFKEGDRGWVASLGRGFILQRGTAPYAANNTTLISAFSGNGYWMLEGQPGEFWGSVADWYIDETNGSDRNAGNTQGEPLASFGELARRLAGATSAITASVWVLSDIANEPPTFSNLPLGSVIIVEGSLGTTSGAGGNITAVSGYAGGSIAANQHFEIDVDVAAATLVGKLLRIASGALCYGVYAVGANKLRTTPFIDPATTATVTPVAEAFTVETPPTISDKPRISGTDNDQSITFRQLFFTDTSLLPGEQFASSVDLIACRFKNGYWEVVSGYTRLIGCLIYGVPAEFNEFDVWENATLRLEKSAIVSTFAFIFLYEGAHLDLVGRTLMQSGASVLSRARGNVQLSSLAVYDASYLTIDLVELCTLRIASILLGDYIYGTGNATEILSLGSQVKATYGTKANLISTGASNPVIFKGYANQTWAALPTVKTAAAADSQATFVLAN